MPSPSSSSSSTFRTDSQQQNPPPPPTLPASTQRFSIPSPHTSTSASSPSGFSLPPPSPRASPRDTTSASATFPAPFTSANSRVSALAARLKPSYASSGTSQAAVAAAPGTVSNGMSSSSHHHSLSSASSSASATSLFQQHQRSGSSTGESPDAALAQYSQHGNEFANMQRRTSPVSYAQDAQQQQQQQTPQQSKDEASGSGSSSAKKRKNSPAPGKTKDTPPRGGSDSAERTKRVKTARACDSCRRKKIRCDVVDDGGPTLGDPNNGNGGLTCVHCRQYGFECTFFLPITETRFKKKSEREREEAANAQAAAQAAYMRSFGAVPAASMYAVGPPPPLQQQPQLMPPQGVPVAGRYAGYTTAAVGIPRLDSQEAPRISATQEWPPRHDARFAEGLCGPRPSYLPDSPHRMLAPPAAGQSARGADARAAPPPDTRVLGPTSISYIVHSTAFVPGAAIEAHDLKHHQTFEVGASGDGIIKFHKPPRRGPASVTSEGDEGEAPASVSDSLRSRLAADVAEKLTNTYFEKTALLFPCVTKSEFLQTPPPPLLLYAICGIAALSREVPREVLGAIRTTINAFFKENDLLSTSNIDTVKALLIMSLHSDLHGLTNVQSGSRCWNRTGTAIRMAQDLGMHRDASGRDDVDDDAFFLEQKRRIWGCCVTADRCTSISLGHPLAISLTDCDVRLPSPHEVLRRPTDLPSHPDLERPFAFNTEMLKLSILFGRTMKTIYSPTGLMKTNDEEIVGLLTDIDSWQESLPPELKYQGRNSAAPAGILHTAFACLQHLFFRVFMRISYNCPQHLSFSLNIERMTAMIKNAREAIEWVDVNEYVLDTLQFVSYCLVFCATVQYHAWMRRGEQVALATLKMCKECVTRFDGDGQRERLSLRAKTAEVITLLYESALGAYATDKNTPSSGALNPTAGVSNKRTADTVRGIVFKADQTKPGGGVYIAADRSLLLNDLPTGTILLHETAAGRRVPALVRTANTEINGGWQPVPGAPPSRQNTSTDGTPTGVSPQGQTPEDLTYVAGGVWADAQGKPVDRRGSRLLTMIPVGAPGSGAWNANGTAPGMTGVEPSAATSNVNPDAPNVNPHLNDTAWMSSLMQQEAYVFDGQNLAPAQNFFMPNTGVESLMLDGFPDGIDWTSWADQLSRVNGAVDGDVTGASATAEPVPTSGVGSLDAFAAAASSAAPMGQLSGNF